MGRSVELQQQCGVLANAKTSILVAKPVLEQQKVMLLKNMVAKGAEFKFLQGQLDFAKEMATTKVVAFESSSKDMFDSFEDEFCIAPKRSRKIIPPRTLTFAS